MARRDPPAVGDSPYDAFDARPIPWAAVSGCCSARVPRYDELLDVLPRHPYAAWPAEVAAERPAGDGSRDRVDPSLSSSSEAAGGGGGQSSGEAGSACLSAAAAAVDPHSLVPALSESEAAALANDWNEAFQSLLERPCTTAHSVKRRQERIDECWRRFADACKPAVRLVVSELHLPASERTLPPANVGGLAGGEKYVVGGCFLKLARDNGGYLFGGDEAGCMKCAGHELNGTRWLVASGVSNLHLALVAVLDYLGHRVLCTSLLPLSADTLRYGSSDAGRHICADSSVGVLVDEAARRLNLKPHVVGGTVVSLAGDVEGHLGRDGRRYLVDCARVFPPVAPVSGNGDAALGFVIESDGGMHLAPAPLLPCGALDGDRWSGALADGELLEALKNATQERVEALLGNPSSGVRFVLSRMGARPAVVVAADCPHAPDERIAGENAAVRVTVSCHSCGDAVVLSTQQRTGGVLFELMRPELVAENSVPLSSDALSGFGRHDMEIHNAEVVGASGRLLNVQIPTAANEFDSLAAAAGSSEAIMTQDDGAADPATFVKGILHRNGVNTRFLGRVRTLCEHPASRELLLVEILARTLRHQLWSALRGLDGRAKASEHATLPGGAGGVAAAAPRLHGAIAKTFNAMLCCADADEACGTLCCEGHLQFVLAAWKSFPGFLGRTELGGICVARGGRSHSCTSLWSLIGGAGRQRLFRVLKSITGVSVAPLCLQRPVARVLPEDVLGVTPRAKRVDSVPVRTAMREAGDVSLAAVAADLRAELASREVALGPNHRQVARVLVHLADVLCLEEATHKQAEPLLLRAVEICRALQHEETAGHPSTRLTPARARLHLSDALARMAAFYSTFGRFEESLVMHRELLALLEGAAASHRERSAICSSKANLASLLREMGNTAEAAPLYEEVVAIRRREWEEDARKGGVSRDGDAAAAQPLFEGDPEVPKSPATALTNLALCLRALDPSNASRCVELLSEARELHERRLGTDSPGYAHVLNALAAIKSDLGKGDESVRLLREVVAIREATLGTQHPKVANALNNCAKALRSVGQLDEAMDMYSRALEIRHRALGDAHPTVATTLLNLGVIYRAQFDAGDGADRRLLHEARRCFAQAAKIRLAKYGRNHPSYAAAVRQEAGTLRALGKVDAADALLQQLSPELRAPRSPSSPPREVYSPPAPAAQRGAAEATVPALPPGTSGATSHHRVESKERSATSFTLSTTSPSSTPLSTPVPGATERRRRAAAAAEARARKAATGSM